MAEVGYATLGIIPSFDGFERNLTHGTSGTMSKVGGASGSVFGTAAGKTAGSRFGSVFKSAAKAGLVGVAALGVGAFKLAKDSISAASDLEESTNKVQQVFGKGADAVFRFSEKAADRLGQTNQAARDAAATFGLFGNIAGLSDKKSAKFATKMTTLASDLASFHNTEPSEAVEALGAALRGESEPIRSYGVLLDEAALKAEALRLGLLEPVKDQAKIKAYQISVIEGQRAYNAAVKEFGAHSFEAEKAQASLGTRQELLQKATEGTIPPLTQQQKVLAAQSAIFKQTEVAQGDFARTSDGLANQQRRLSARFEDAKAKLGVGLLPIMTQAADFLLDKGIPAFEDFSTWFNEKGIPGIKDFADKVKPVAKDLLPTVKDSLSTIRDIAKKAAPVVKGLFDGFNKLPDGLKSAILIGAGATFAAKKFGASSLLGSALSMAKPMPVFVTNPGFGAGGLPGTGGKPAPGGKLGTARNAGRLLAPFAIADGIYEVSSGDLYGIAPKKPKTDPFVAQSGGPFGAALPRPEIDDPFNYMSKSAREALHETAEEFRKAKLPTELKTHIAIYGAPQAKSEIRGLIREYDLTPKEKSTLFRVLGVERAHDQIDNLAGALDNLATNASDAFDHLGDVSLGRGRGGGRPRDRGRDRNRRRALGGVG